MSFKPSSHVSKWAAVVVLVLLLATTSLVVPAPVRTVDGATDEAGRATAQSAELHIPLVVGGEDTSLQAPGSDDHIEMPAESDTEESIASIAAYNSSNWYVSSRLGVGTDNPAHRLGVIGGPAWTSVGWQGSIELANGAAIGWRTNPAGQRFGLGHTNSGFYVFRTASNPGTTGSAPVNDLVINNSGYVGIGTTTPAHQLSINGGPAWTQSSWAGAVDLSDSSAIAWQPNSNGYSFGVGQTHTGLYFFHTTSAPGTTGTPPSYDLTVGNSGAVGIGTTTPIFDLHVKGTARIEEGNLSVCCSGSDINVTNGDIVVNNGNFIDTDASLNVPDYVFEPEYPLMSLDELRAYVATEKHLPNVPSEEEIRAGGLNLTDFQMKLLEKTEELTLYTLAQDEQITSQQQEIETLQQVVELLKQQNADLEARLAALEEQE
jgi:hypothetical protein